MYVAIWIIPTFELEFFSAIKESLLSHALLHTPYNFPSYPSQYGQFEFTHHAQTFVFIVISISAEQHVKQSVTPIWILIDCKYCVHES